MRHFVQEQHTRQQQKHTIISQQQQLATMTMKMTMTIVLRSLVSKICCIVPQLLIIRYYSISFHFSPLYPTHSSPFLCMAASSPVAVVIAGLLFSDALSLYYFIINNLLDSNNTRTHHFDNHPTLSVDYKSQHDADNEE